MKTEIDKAIKLLTESIKGNVNSVDALRFTQAALNLAHTQSVIIQNEKEEAKK